MDDNGRDSRLAYALVGAGSIAGIQARALSRVPRDRLAAVAWRWRVRCVRVHGATDSFAHRGRGHRSGDHACPHGGCGTIVLEEQRESPGNWPTEARRKSSACYASARRARRVVRRIRWLSGRRAPRAIGGDHGRASGRARPGSRWLRGAQGRGDRSGHLRIGTCRRRTGHSRGRMVVPMTAAT